MLRKITALKVQKRNPNRINVYLDGAFAFGLARIVAAWLQVGQELAEEKIAALQADDSLEAAYQQALKFLQPRPRSEAEVRQNLARHGSAEDVIEAVLERLRQNSLVNDARFAQAWVENRNDFRPRSQRALQYELKRMGVAQEVIEQAVEQNDDEDLAYQAASRQARKLAHLEWPVYRQKMIAFLGRRGFDYSRAAAAASRTWAEQHSKEVDA